MNRNHSDNWIAFVLLAWMAFSSIRNSAYSSPAEWLMNEILILPGILIGLSFHEFGHAVVADRLGDPTPRMQGRVTVNPLAHIDLFGLIALLFAGFGWGKSVEIDPRYFKKPRRDEMLVSVAGVVMNLITAIGFTFVLRIYIHATGAYSQAPGMAGSIYMMLFYIIDINLVLMIFNLLPVPPLDGFNLITELFRLRRYRWWYTLYNNGFMILMLLIIFRVTDLVLLPCIRFFLNLLSGLL